MKIVETPDLGSLDLLMLRDAPVPKCGAEDVLIKVAACGIGYVDALMTQGRYQVRPPVPFTPGQEAAGWIHAVGPEVSGFAVGDRVLANVHKGLAEFALADVPTLHRIPAALDFCQAAGFRINYLTAAHAFLDRAQLQPGETLLVLGAAGGVGSAAVQVGKALGADVIAVASTHEKREFAKLLGADAVLDSEPEAWRDRLKSICARGAPDVVFDPICGPLFELAFRSLALGGRHLVVGFTGGEIPTLRANLPLLKSASLVGVDARNFQIFHPERAEALIGKLLDWVDEGVIVPPVGPIFRLGDAVGALKCASSGLNLGKVIVRIASDE